MRESVTEMKEVVVRAITDKSNTDRNFATVSTLPFQCRNDAPFCHGSRNDPSRMAANFAGVVSNNDARNDIVIRGQFPRYGLLWRFSETWISPARTISGAWATPAARSVS